MFAIGLFVVALALRLYVASALAGEPVWDGHYYDFGARRIASGFGYADEVMRDGHAVWHPWCHYPVGYSGFLAAFYMLFGTGHARRALRERAGGRAARGGHVPARARGALAARGRWSRAALVALHPGLVLYGALLMTEPLSALLVLGAFYVAIRVARAGAARATARRHRGAGARARPRGARAAAGAALRAVPGARAPARGAGAARRDVWRQRALGLAVACGVALVPVLPWTARNCRVMDGCALVSTNAGWNLAIGSFPRATGRFETLRSDDGCREVTGQVQQDRCWLEYGLANIKSAPGRWLALVPAKLAFTFDHESFAVEYLREARPAAWPEERRVAVRGVLTSVHRILVAASALAFVALALRGDRRARRVQTALLAALALAAYAAFAAGTPTFWPIVLVACALPWLPLPGRPPAHPALLMSVSLIATTALAHAIFFGEDRYHMVATPVLCLLAAAALRAPAALQRHAPVRRTHRRRAAGRGTRAGHQLEQPAPLDS